LVVQFHLIIAAMMEFDGVVEVDIAEDMSWHRSPDAILGSGQGSFPFADDAMSFSKRDLKDIVSHGVVDAMTKLGMLERHTDVMKAIAPIEDSVIQIKASVEKQRSQMLEALRKIKVEVDPPDFSGIQSQL
jgi:hypothetical protein